MKSTLLACLLLLLGSGNCFAGSTLEEQNRLFQLQIHRAQVQSIQDQARMDQFNAQLLADIAAKKAEQAAAELREQARKAAEKAAQDFEYARQQQEQAAVKTRNDIYVFGMVMVLVGSAAFLRKIRRRGTPMVEHEKFGIAMIIVSILCAAFFLIISSNWAYTLDFINNLMVTLRIQFFASESDQYGIPQFSIDVPTKYFIFACLLAAAYGVTTYVGITPVLPRKAALPQQE